MPISNEILIPIKYAKCDFYLSIFLYYTLTSQRNNIYSLVPPVKHSSSKCSLLRHKCHSHSFYSTRNSQVCSLSLTSSIMVSMASDSSALVASLATMFLSLRQYSLSCNTQQDKKQQSALTHRLQDLLLCGLE